MSSGKVYKHKSRKVICAGHVARMGDRIGANRCLVGRPGRKRSLGRLRRRCEYNIKMGLQGMRWGAIDWIDLAQDRDRWRAFVNAVINL
jgi:hypothetical protein